MKTILLELTPKEAEVVQSLVASRKTQIRDEKEDPTDFDRRIERCSTILGKIENALRPQQEELITYKDLFHILSMAKDEYLFLPNNLQISRKNVEKSNLVSISLAKSVIMWLSSRNLLKRLASFDVTDGSIEFEDGND